MKFKNLQVLFNIDNEKERQQFHSLRKIFKYTEYIISELKHIIGISMEIESAVSKIKKSKSSPRTIKTKIIHIVKNVNVDEILLSYLIKNNPLMDKNIDLYEIMFLNKKFINYEKCFQKLFLKSINEYLFHKMNMYKKME